MSFSDEGANVRHIPQQREEKYTAFGQPCVMSTMSRTAVAVFDIAIKIFCFFASGLNSCD
jgi:hypothetical protein